MSLTVYLGVNVELYGPAGRQGWIVPVVPLTRLVSGYYRLRRLANQVSAAAKLACIGLSVARFAMGV